MRSDDYVKTYRIYALLIMEICKVFIHLYPGQTYTVKTYFLTPFSGQS